MNQRSREIVRDACCDDCLRGGPLPTAVFRSPLHLDEIHDSPNVVRRCGGRRRHLCKSTWGQIHFLVLEFPFALVNGTHGRL